MKNAKDWVSRHIVLFVVCVILVSLTAAILISYRAKNASGNSSGDLLPTSAPIVSTDLTDYDSVVVDYEGSEKTTIATDVIQDGLKEMGVLITEEYYFTEAVYYSNTKNVLVFFPSESSFLATYDGKILAGVDFNQVTVTKDDANKTITITVPKAAIQSVDIDPNSFNPIEEKEGLGNSIKLEDYNNSMIQLESNAREKALNRGILDQADSNAETVIKSFAESLIGTEDYSINIIHKS